MFDVIALGELLIDFVCKSTNDDGYPTMAANPGGAPGNYLAALNAYGAKTVLISKVGDDNFGNLLIGTLSKAGIETTGIVIDPSVFTTLTFVTIDSTGNRNFSFARKPGADTQLCFDEVDLGLIDNSKVFHFGSLSLTCEPIRSTTQKCIAYAKQKGNMITFDPNLRIPLWKNLEEAKEQILWGMKQADIVKISEEEVVFLFGCDEKSSAKILIEEYGVKLVFVTLGENGCFFANANGNGYVSTCLGLKVIDTTGAGDIFGGSAVSRILKLKKAPQTLTVDEMIDITEFACTAAGLSTEHFGGIPSVQPEDVVLLRKNTAVTAAVSIS